MTSLTVGGDELVYEISEKVNGQTRDFGEVVDATGELHKDLSYKTGRTYSQLSLNDRTTVPFVTEKG